MIDRKEALKKLDAIEKKMDFLEKHFRGDDEVRQFETTD
jgi:hypothetical protein